MGTLIITADDFGLSKEVNDAVEEAHRRGVLSAASLMVAGPAAGHAVAIARRNPGLRVGLHLVLSSGAAVSAREAIPDLLEKDGRLASMMHTAFALLRPIVRRQLATEIAAQFAAFARTGLVLDHVNAHEHFHVHPMVAAAVLAVGREYGMKALRVPSEPGDVVAAVEQTPSPAWVHLMRPWTALLRYRVREAGLLAPDAVFGVRWSGRMTAARIRGLLRHLPPGVTEIYTHPATRDEFAGNAPGYRHRDELAALTDESVVRLMRAAGHCAVGYADISSRPDITAAGRRPAGTIRSHP